MTSRYEKIVADFNEKGCQLLDTYEQYIETITSAKKSTYKLNYIASCGHKHIVYYNVFKGRGTGIICPSCKNKEIGNNKKQQIKNNEMSKTAYMDQEHTFILKIIDLLKDEFDIVKAFDGCHVDLIFKPKHIENEWVGIQIKTSHTIHLTYSFHLHTNYKDCLLLFYCCEDGSMWLVPENTITNQKKVSIGYNKSKYNIYKTTNDDIKLKLNEFYEKTTKFAFETLDTPANFYQQREKEFRKYREEKIDYIRFDNPNREGTVYDFKIGELKIQEKVSKISEKENRFCFQLCKNNGVINKKNNQIQYDIGDNDFYWLNCDNKKYFFVIPEKILIEKDIIGNNKKNTFLKITVKENLHKNSAWLQPYLFDYDNIDKDRLMNTLSI